MQLLNCFSTDPGVNPKALTEMEEETKDFLGQAVLDSLDVDEQYKEQ